MKNTHIEHPEDSILTGDLSVLDWFAEPDSYISTKIDGAPAIVWGTDPATNTFFVGTKAVFNKVKIRIAHNHEEIDAFYQGKVARILHACFDCLPRTTSIFQGDFIGFGGSDSYRPNTVTYIFPEIIAEDIIIAPHTIYVADDDLRNAVSSPMILSPKSTDECLFVKPEVSLHPYREDLGDICKYAKQMATLCQFSWLNDKTAAKVKKHINDCIRHENAIDEDEIAEKFDIDINVMRLWKLVATIKDDLFCFIDERDDIECMIGNMHTLHEGYVITNKYGMFKVVDRQEFSRANFIMEKTW
tara:strand:+ start:1957 stop:2859 length:903 start_codon:yes stop_codon:yes gene_type:complete